MGWVLGWASVYDHSNDWVHQPSVNPLWVLGGLIKNWRKRQVRSVATPWLKKLSAGSYFTLKRPFRHDTHALSAFRASNSMKGHSGNGGSFSKLPKSFVQNWSPVLGHWANRSILGVVIVLSGKTNNKLFCRSVRKKVVGFCRYPQHKFRSYHKVKRALSSCFLCPIARANEKKWKRLVSFHSVQIKWFVLNFKMITLQET